MPQIARLAGKQEYLLMPDSMLRGISETNEEFLNNLRKSIRKFRNSSVIAKETLAKEALRETLAEIHNLLTWKANWNNYESLAPEPAAVMHAENWILQLFLMVEDVGLLWVKPNVTASADGEVVFEWWYCEKKLTVYISDKSAEYVQGWGSDINSEMSDGDAESVSACRLLWMWLISG
jgi:hypothetical protein